MSTSCSAWLCFSLLFFQLLHLVICDSDGITAAGVFTYPTDAGADFTFALNTAPNGDLAFHLSGPSAYSWIAIGIGEDMDDSLMFILHEANDDGAVTLSPRVAMHGTSEPTYYPAVHCEQVETSLHTRKRDDEDKIITINAVNAICHNATAWQGGALDLASSSQEWMFAFGPNGRLRSSSMSAPLIRHQLYGNFKMDMRQATSTGADGATVPSPNGSGEAYTTGNSSEAEDVKSDNDKSSIIHGVVMCVAYVLLYPLGALLLRLSKRIPVRLHWICQSIASVLVLVGFGLGVVASGEYDRSRDYDDPHQIIGIVLLVAVIVQLALGGVHHLLFKKRNKSTILGKIHLVIGPVIILLAMVNGGLGLNLALARGSTVIVYAVVVAVFGVIVFGLRAWYEVRGRRTQVESKLAGAMDQNDDVSLNNRGFTATQE